MRCDRRISTRPTRAATALATLALAVASAMAMATPPSPSPMPTAVAEHVEGAESGHPDTATTAVAPVSLDALPEPLARLLPQMPEPDAMRLRRRATRWQAWPPQAHAAFAERAAAWDALTWEQRARRREAWQAWQALPDEQRERVRGIADGFAQRPKAEQDDLRMRFAALPQEQRRGWLLGPMLGADYPALHPLLAQLPAEQQRPLLDVLRSMTAAQRRQLGVLVQRTPPQARDALRLELIATPADRRQQWLWDRLGR
ncbi:DUF3106 domain-containing protein [Marilutibacter chinensis]|uniref:DUF3106 domain-containing protein n=1 Tax=Marilutibacter chinensis TaxID=2912247 RepID=A0ABS9HTP8_9GAMM|nr:DUF3106 domain-containing protein [Lysobacter chinensis]MCF7221584.1 DUF3106 domain-containing protein [Lysobacter chinensis]